MTKESPPRPCACTTIRKAARVLARTYDAAIEPTGMNVTQLAVMRAVLRHPSDSLSRVAEDLDMDRTTLYRAIEALQRRRWVTIRDGKDNRSRSASITKRGDAALAQADPAWGRIQRDIVDRFGRVEWQSLVRDLQRLIDCASDVAVGRSATGSRP